MRARHYAATAVLAGLMLGEGSSLAAQSRPNRPTVPSPNPESYRQLREEVARRALGLGQKSKVVCGTTVIPADPMVDRRAIKPVPEKGPKSTIRQVPPPACR